MRNIYPVMFFAASTLALPHGGLETCAAIGTLIAGAIGIWRTFKR